MSINPIILSIPVYFILIVIEWVIDAIKGKKRYRLGDVIGNIGCGITEQVSGMFVKVALIGVYTLIYENFKIWDVPHTWYWFVVLFIATDFFYYWAHRMSHEINLFWIGHIVHHQSEDYNFSVALRQGTFQKIFTAPFFWPLAILGFDPVWFLLASAFVTLYQFWIHTEYIDKMGWFEYIFNTPSHHRVHHGRDPKYIDKNHAGTFIIWDKMFGTFQAEEETPNYGITTQTGTFNPITATLKPLTELWLKVVRTPTFAGKLKALFYGPAWSAIPVSQKEITCKYDVHYTPREIGYLSILLAENIVFSAYLLFNYEVIHISNLVLYSTALLISLWVTGSFADKRPYANWFEITRISIFFAYVLTTAELYVSIYLFIRVLLSIVLSIPNINSR